MSDDVLLVLCHEGNGQGSGLSQRSYDEPLRMAAMRLSGKRTLDQTCDGLHITWSFGANAHAERGCEA